MTAATESGSFAILAGKMFEIGQEFGSERNFEGLFNFGAIYIAIRPRAISQAVDLEYKESICV